MVEAGELGVTVCFCHLVCSIEYSNSCLIPGKLLETESWCYWPDQITLFVCIYMYFKVPTASLKLDAGLTSATRDHVAHVLQTTCNTGLHISHTKPHHTTLLIFAVTVIWEAILGLTQSYITEQLSPNCILSGASPSSPSASAPPTTPPALCMRIVCASWASILRVMKPSWLPPRLSTSF